MLKKLTKVSPSSAAGVFDLEAEKYHKFLKTVTMLACTAWNLQYNSASTNCD